MNAVELESVRKAHSGALALDGLSFSVPEGKLVVLLGLSGCGKTTALKLINRMLEPDAGRVQVLGRDAAAWDPVALRRRTGWVIQEAGLMPHMTALENAGLVLRLLGVELRQREERGRELLRLVGLDPERVAALAPHRLSGGERQRVGLARALAAEPPLMLMDEPFGALDPITRRRLQDEFRELQRRLGTSVVLVTHDLREALRLADEVVVMHEGRVAQRGTPDEIRDAPREGFVREFVGSSG